MDKMEDFVFVNIWRYGPMQVTNAEPKFGDTIILTNVKYQPIVSVGPFQYFRLFHIGIYFVFPRETKMKAINMDPSLNYSVLDYNLIWRYAKNLNKNEADEMMEKVKVYKEEHWRRLENVKINNLCDTIIILDENNRKLKCGEKPGFVIDIDTGEERVVAACERVMYGLNMFAGGIRVNVSQSVGREIFNLQAGELFAKYKQSEIAKAIRKLEGSRVDLLVSPWRIGAMHNTSFTIETGWCITKIVKYRD